MRKFLIIILLLCGCARKPIKENELSTAQIQAIIDSAYKDSGVVFIPQCVYQMDSLQQPRHHITLIGESKEPIQKDANIPIIHMKGDWNEATAGDRRGIYDADSFRDGKYRVDTTGTWYFDSTSDWGGMQDEPVIWAIGVGDTTKRK